MAEVIPTRVAQVGAQIYVAKMTEALFLGPCDDVLLVLSLLMKRLHANETLKFNSLSEE